MSEIKNIKLNGTKLPIGGSGGSGLEPVFISMDAVSANTAVLTNNEVERIKNGCLVKYGFISEEEGIESIYYPKLDLMEVFNGEGMIALTLSPIVTDNGAYIEYEVLRLFITLTSDDNNTVTDNSTRLTLSKHTAN